MAAWIRGILRPEIYHGHGKRPPFFEGWYFKVVDASEASRFAFIPGVYLDRDSAKTHAFVQVLDGSAASAHYCRYSFAEFWASKREFDIRIGPNRFTQAGISLELNCSGRAISGQLDFAERKPWPVTLRLPGAMGTYAWLPFMECYHGVVSMDHQVSGSLIVEGAAVSFDSGRGYIEKDWGQSFPSGWLWIQSNHFERPGISLMASIAVIPWLRRPFPGFIVGLLLDGALYRFATYTGAKLLELDLSANAGRFVIQDRRLRLEVSAQSDEVAILHGPTRTDMGPRVAESLRGRVDVRLSHLSDRGTALFEGTGRNAGIEVNGDISRLMDLARSETGGSPVPADLP